MKVALVHDWLTGMRGGEALLEAVTELYPEAPIYTLICEPQTLSPRLRSRRIVTSWMQKLPGGVSRYKHYLPLMPTFIRGFDLRGYDLIISISHCVAKGIRKPADAKHLSYVNAPMRYMWDRFDEYFGPGKASLPVRLAAHIVRPYLQWWDRRVSQTPNVDRIIGNSDFIASQIVAHYGRAEAGSIHPFVDHARFTRNAREEGEFYFSFGAWVPYKRVDLAIEACNRLGKRLIVAGSGQEEARLRAIAGPTIEFRVRPSDQEIEELYRTCRAFIFPGIEDFGITPLEAMASGAPVVAFAQGGALETVTPETGLFFDEQTPEALARAIETLPRDTASRVEACRARSRLFGREEFKCKLLAEAQALLK